LNQISLLGFNKKKEKKQLLTDTDGIEVWMWPNVSTCLRDESRSRSSFFLLFTTASQLNG